MEDKYLEDLLFEIGNEDINLPQSLIENTKEKINHRYFLSITSLSVFLNIFSLVSLLIVIYFKFSFVGLISLYILWSFISSLSILSILVFKDTLMFKTIINNKLKGAS